MSELDHRATPFDSIKQIDEAGQEYWLGRDIMEHTDYRDWRNFNAAVTRAMTAMAGLGEDTRGHFSVLAPKSTGGRPRQDIILSRRACYLVFMNGDPEEREIALAQNYFAQKTREAEVLLPALPGTYLDALKALVTEVEARERAELLRAEAEAERDELKPPAEAWQTLADTGQDYSVREAAYILKRDTAIADRVGPRRLFDWIVSHSMAQRKPDGQYVPYAAHSDHLRLAPRSRPDHGSGGFKEAHAQLRVTVRGLSWIQQRMREETRPELVSEGERAEVIDFTAIRTAPLRR